MSKRVLWHQGQVHSAEYPFATAVEATNGIITWIGDADTGADRSAEADEVVDLAGGVVMPAFVDVGGFLAGIPARDRLSGWADAGVTAGSLAVTAQEIDEGLPQELLESAKGHVEFIVSDDVSLALSLANNIGAQRVAVAVNKVHARQVADARASGLPVIINTRDSSSVIDAVVAEAPDSGLVALQWWSGVRWLGDLPEELSLPGVMALTWLAGPDADAERALEHGINTVVLLREDDTKCDPWGTIDQATASGGSWSGRSIIRSLTRSAWRMWSDHGCGDIALGQRAALAAWQGDAGVDVVSPKGSLASWSAEAQSGMPVLPACDAGERPTLTHFAAQ